MKILRNLIILVFASFVVTSCEKSTTQPRKCGNESQSQEQTNATQSGMIQSSDNIVNTNNESARSSVVIEEEASTTYNANVSGNGDPQSGDVSGSGDDDRDGGERRRKR